MWVRSKRLNIECVAHAYALVPQPAPIPTPILESLEMSERMITRHVCAIVFDALTSLIIHMYSHSEVSCMFLTGT